MTAVETIQAAIDRLTEIQRERRIEYGWLVEYGPLARAGTGDDRMPLVNALEHPDSPDVTLHRTIDAQLAILRDDYESCVKTGWIPDRHVLELAEAILGGTE